MQGHEEREMKRVFGLASVCCLLLALAGCAGISPAQTKAYLDGVSVSLPDLSVKPDGVYSGSYKLAMPHGGMAAFPFVSVEVTMKSGRIESITMTKPQQLASGKFYDAIVTGPTGVIARQSLGVDAVAGASYSSKAFLKAVENALSK